LTTFGNTWFRRCRHFLGNFPLNDYGEKLISLKKCHIDIKVVGSHFNGSPVTIAGSYRSWNNPGLAPEAVIETDYHLRTFEAELPGGGRRIEFSLNSPSPAYIAARLGDAEGPILDSTRIEPLSFIVIPDLRKHTVVETFDDGSVMVEGLIVLSHVPDDLKVHLRIFVSGHTFDDGTIERTVTAADFDQYGVLPLPDHTFAKCPLRRLPSHNHFARQ